MTQTTLPRPSWLMGLLWGVLGVWLGLGGVALIMSEPPHGRLDLRVIARETGTVLAKANVQLSQGEQSWDVRTDAQGEVHLPTMPTGDYQVYADSRAHRLEKGKFTLQEGEQKQLVLALPPVEPFLEVINPQPVFLPEEAAKIGLRGFVKGAQLNVEIMQLQLGSEAPVTEVFDTLDEVRLGWYRGSTELRQRLRALRPFLKPVQQQQIPVQGRDVEGVFLQYTPFPVKTAGTYLVRFRTGNLEAVTLVVITQTGLVVKSNDQQQLVWVSHLKTGLAQANIPVEVWADGGTGSQRLVATRTNAMGLAQFNLPATASDRVYIVAQGQQQQPLAWVNRYIGSPEDRTNSPTTEGYIYSERPVYRPGNRVFFKGIVRSTGDGYQLPKADQPVTVTIRDPNDDIVQRLTTKLNTWGSFSGSVVLSEEVKTGSYTILAQVAQSKIAGIFSVAAYRKPTFKISLKPQKSYITAHETMPLTLEAAYFYGLPVASSTVRYTVYRSPKYEWFANGVEEEETDDGTTYGEYVLEGTTRTDAAGKAVVMIQPDSLPQGETNAFTPQNTYRYTVSVTVEAAGNEYAEAETNFLAVQSNWQMQVEPTPYWGAENQPYQVQVNIRDRETQKAQVTPLQWRAGIYGWRGKQAEITWRTQGEAKTNSQGLATWQFTPPESGDWVIETTTTDSQGQTLTAQTSLWVSGDNVADTRPQAPLLQLVTDKHQYQVGERAQIAVRSSVRAGAVLLTVEGEKLHLGRVVQLRDGKGTLEIPILASYQPSAYVSAAFVTAKQLVEQSIPLKIGTQAQQLHVNITTDKPQYEPGEQAQVSIETLTQTGKPLAAEVSLAVVDESLYRVQEDRPQGLFDTFYARRPNRIETQYSFPWIAVQGDKASGETVRRNFPDTALWLPQVVTNAQGKATVSVKVPDTLTQWRITVLGHTRQSVVGAGVARFISTKPFTVRLAAPTLLTEGDTTQISALVSNNSAQPQEATVELVAGGQTQRAQARVEPGTAQTFQWSYRADRIGAFPLLVRAQSGSGQRDAEERQLQVVPYATQQLTSQWFAAEPGSNVRSIAVTVGMVPEASRLQVRLAPSVFAQFLGAVDYLVGYPYGCTEQTMSRFLPSLLVDRVLKQKNISLPAIQTQIPAITKKSLARLYRFQHFDGGWGWWEFDENNLYMTAHVMRGLTLARAAGVPVREVVYTKGRESLVNQIQAQWEQGLIPKKDSYRNVQEDYVFALYALAMAGGDLPVNAQGRALLPTTNLSSYSQAVLTLAFQKWRRIPQATALRDALLDKAQTDTHGLYWQQAKTTANWITPAETTSWAILALLEAKEPNPEAIRSAVGWLLAQRRAEGWQSTKDTAVAIEALLAYTQRYEKSATTAAKVRIFLNEILVGETTVTALTSWSPETILNIPVNILKPGDNALRLEVENSNTPLYTTILFRQGVGLTDAPKPEVQLERQYFLLKAATDGKGNPVIEERLLRPDEAIPAGSLLRVRDRVKAWKQQADHLIIEDPLPSGFRSLEESESDNRYEEGSSYTLESRDDRMIGYFLGVYGDTLAFTYQLRAEIPGEYRILPPKLWAMYGDFSLQGQPTKLKVVPNR